MVECEVVEDRIGNLTVTFNNNTDLYLQTDYTRAAFGVACGKIKAPRDWSGCPSELADNWWEIDWEDIKLCPEEYQQQAEPCQD